MAGAGNSLEQFPGRSLADMAASGKLAAFIELMDEAEASNEKALIRL